MDSLDIIFACFLLYSTARGYSKGFLRTLALMASPVLAVMAGLRWAVPAGVLLSDYVRFPDALSGLVAVPQAFRPAAGGEQPEGLLAILGFVLVFLFTVIVLRLSASLLSTVLGLSESLSNRLLGAALSLAVGALLLGTGISVVRATATAEIRDAGPARLLTGRALSLAERMDARLAATKLGPPLGAFAGYFLSAALELQRNADDSAAGLLGARPKTRSRRAGCRFTPRPRSSAWSLASLAGVRGSVRI